MKKRPFSLRYLGHYEILEPLGKGGMGEVYRARDTKLDRDVAIKVLPSELAASTEHAQRFEREAKAVAALDHPNIVGIHSIELAEGLGGESVHFITMQLVEGETLSELIPRNGFPLDTLFDLGIQLADAVSSAHEQGITHRDLKPGNVMVTDSGRVKVLDFGLAKLLETEIAAAEVTHAATAQAEELTEEGKVLGTVSYMSPEQAEGKSVDHRTDIFSLGIMLYEMATGERPFKGDTKVSIVSSIVKDTPTSVTQLNGKLPRHLGRIVKKSLEKDPIRRYQSVIDLRNDLHGLKEEIVSGELLPSAPTAVASPMWQRAMLPGLTGVFLLVALLASVLWGGWGDSWWTGRASTSATTQPLTRFLLPLPKELGGEEIELRAGIAPAFAISPDGTHLVFVAHTGRPELFSRPMDQLVATRIDGTQGAYAPFFSPDGQRVGFFASGELKSVPLSGGVAMKISDAPNGRGASWGPDDTIIFAPSPDSGLWSVSASGGAPQRLTVPDTEQGEQGHWWPQTLPGGKAVLFSVNRTDRFDRAIAVVSLEETDEPKVLIESGSFGRYAPTNHLLFVQDWRLFAVPFDFARLEITGAPTQVVDGYVAPDMGNFPNGAAQFAFSDSGTLVYLPWEPELLSTIVSVDMQGVTRPLVPTTGGFFVPRLSPDGKLLAIGETESWQGDAEMGLVVYDVTTGARTSFALGREGGAVWSPDGEWLAFGSSENGKYSLVRRPADGSGDAEQLLESERPIVASSLSPDGRELAYQELHPSTGWDIWVLALEERTPQPFLRTQYDERAASFSPDGRWLAYVSNASGRDEVYVRPHPGPGDSTQISRDGGAEPVWAPNGHELFYRVSGVNLMVVVIETQPTFAAAGPRPLIEGSQYTGPMMAGIGGIDVPNYDVAPDGESFVMLAIQWEPPDTPLTVVLNWFEELKRLVPTGGSR